MDSGKKNPFFKASDLQGLEFNIEGLNQTSRLPLPKGTITIVQMLEDGLILVFPPKSCALNHIVTLQVRAKKLIDEKTVVDHNTHVTAVIKEIETQADGNIQVRVFFREHVQAQWDALIKYFSEKQYTVNKLVKDTRK